MTKKFNSFYLTLLVVLTGALILAPTLVASAATDQVEFYAADNGTPGEQLPTPYYAHDGQTIFVKAWDGTTSGGSKAAALGSPDTVNDITVQLKDDGSQSWTSDDPDGVYWGSFIVSSTTVSDVDEKILVSEGNAATLKVDLDGAGDRTDTSITADYTAPQIDSAKTVQASVDTDYDVSKIEITFTDNLSGLDADSVDPDNFKIDESGGTTYTAVDGTNDSVSVSGNKVTLTYDDSSPSQLGTGSEPSVALVDSPSTKISDVAGNTTTDGSVTAADDITPVVTNATAFDSDNNGYIDYIGLTFSEVLTANNPTKAAFSVVDSDGTPMTVETVSAGGTGSENNDQVRIDLSNDEGTTGAPDVTYTSGYSVEIQDDASNPNVVGNISPAIDDNVNPVLKSAEYVASSEQLGAETLKLTFSETIAFVGGTSDYTVDYDGSDGDGDFTDGDARQAINVQSVSNADGDNVLNLVIDNQSLQTDPGYKFQVTVNTPADVKDVNGNKVSDTSTGKVGTTADVADFAPGAPQLVAANTGSTLGSSTAARSTIKLKFGEAVQNVDPEDFTVSTGQSVDTTGLSTNIVTLNLGDTLATDATPDVTVESGTGVGVDDYADNTLSGYTFTETEDYLKPEFSSAEATDTKTVEVTFSENLEVGSADKADFEVNSGSPAINNAYVENDVVTLELDSAVPNDAAGTTVSYSAVDTLYDTADNAAVTFSDNSVSDAIAPELLSISWVDNTANTDTGVNELTEEDTVTLTFSEDIKDSTLTDSNVNSNLSADFGTAPSVLHNGSSVDVQLASGEDVAVGDAITPTSSVEDANGNAAAGTSVTIPEIQPVKVSESGNYYDAISSAVSNATSGDTVIVYDHYDYNDEGFPISIGQNVTVQAAADGNDVMPVVDATGETSGTNAFEIGGAYTVTIDGLKVKSADSAAAIQAADAEYELTVQDAKLMPAEDSDGSEYAFGIKSLGTGTLAVAGTTFEGTSTGTYTMGIRTGDNDGSGEDGVIGTAENGNTFKNLRTGIQIDSPADDGFVIENNNFKNFAGDPAGSASASAIYLTSFNAGTSSSFTFDVVDNLFENVGNAVDLQNRGNTINGTVDIVGNGFINAHKGDEPTDGSSGSWDQYAVHNENTDTGIAATVDATENYWNADSGPSGAGPGYGDAVSDNVDYEPWLDVDDQDVISVTSQNIDGTGDWEMISVPFWLNDPSADAVFGEQKGGVFHWNGTNYNSGTGLNDIEPGNGYWFYAGDSVSKNTGAGYRVQADAGIPVDQGWHMISAPFDLRWDEVEVYNTETEETRPVTDLSGWASKYLVEYNPEDPSSGSNYYRYLSPGEAMMRADTGYWWYVDSTDSLELVLPYGPGSEPSGSSMSNAAAALDEKPAGLPTPPAPPSAMEVGTDLSATALTDADGVTFEVTGGDVQAMKVQVFSADGTDVYANEVSSNSLQWDAEVANGVYLYGASAKVDGDWKPLGIQKLLILE